MSETMEGVEKSMEPIEAMPGWVVYGAEDLTVVSSGAPAGAAGLMARQPLRPGDRIAVVGATDIGNGLRAARHEQVMAVQRAVVGHVVVTPEVSTEFLTGLEFVGEDGEVLTAEGEAQLAVPCRDGEGSELVPLDRIVAHFGVRQPGSGTPRESCRPLIVRGEAGALAAALDKCAHIAVDHRCGSVEDRLNAISETITATLKLRGGR